MTRLRFALQGLRGGLAVHSHVEARASPGGGERLFVPLRTQSQQNLPDGLVGAEVSVPLNHLSGTTLTGAQNLGHAALLHTHLALSSSVQAIACRGKAWVLTVAMRTLPGHRPVECTCLHPGSTAPAEQHRSKDSSQLWQPLVKPSPLQNPPEPPHSCRNEFEILHVPRFLQRDMLDFADGVDMTNHIFDRRCAAD